MRDLPVNGPDRDHKFGLFAPCILILYTVVHNLCLRQWCDYVLLSLILFEIIISSLCLLCHGVIYLDLSPDISELDLSKTLLSSWEDVASITKDLQHLRTLNLS